MGMCCWAKMQGGDVVQGTEKWARSPHVPIPEAGQEVMRCGHAGHMLTVALFPSAEPINLVPSRKVKIKDAAAERDRDTPWMRNLKDFNVMRTCSQSIIP